MRRGVNIEQPKKKMVIRSRAEARRHTWMVLTSGKMNSVPHLPGKIPSPNSPPASLTPNHLNLPEAVAVVVVEGGAVLVEVTRVVVRAVVVRAVVVGAAAPGRHWLYQSFT